MTLTASESLSYCASRFTTVRRPTRVVGVGEVPVGGTHPVVVQSMTTTPTQDVEATVAQCIALAEAGCAIVRVTAQNVAAAKALKDIRKKFSAAGFSAVPLVADIHFLPQAAMEAVEHVEKVRINPGNYADKKRFQTHEYSDGEYNAELERLHEAFSPIVLRAKDLGRALRIGTNHGSLSDRIMNRFGDSPEGMCESALEFIRIAESHGFRDIILSMKASNPKVMIHAYRLVAARMDAAGMHYPLHLGVTEAGDGDDARIKSAAGIGALLYDGLGDTIRVSLTEDPVYEIPVARDLADKAARLWRESAHRTAPDPVDPYSYTRRPVETVSLGPECVIAPLEPPRVIQPVPAAALADPAALGTGLANLRRRLPDTPLEGLLIRVAAGTSAGHIAALGESVRKHVNFCVWDVSALPLPAVEAVAESTRAGDMLLFGARADEPGRVDRILAVTERRRMFAALDLPPEDLPSLADVLAPHAERLVFTLSAPPADGDIHPLGVYRQLAETVDSLGLRAPLWIRATAANAVDPRPWFGDQLLEASLLAGPLLCDGLGDLLSIETVADPAQSLTLAYNILQAARARTTKTEYVACPSCGRTLFDLQSTTQRIRAATGHLKGVTIAVMGCIVNGPGEMADADFGYVGGSPGKINLYVGKTCVKFHIPAADAVDELIKLIKENNRWTDPPTDGAAD
ncbi:MAG: (E)-4-hydroxy-3-methylbut-2-enyl-diphosphate synthase [Opitutales bacterium]|nr:(E)-4-hydroxy-3-methylbut-2-enyl-diphosphate synthase [Opitutales bacterium]